MFFEKLFDFVTLSLTHSEERATLGSDPSAVEGDVRTRGPAEIISYGPSHLVFMSPMR